DPFRSLCAVFDCNPGRTARSIILAVPSRRQTRGRIIDPGYRQFRHVRIFFRRLAILNLYSGAYRERQARSRRREMTSSRVLNAPWLPSGPTARVLELLNENGEEARVVGGAVRNALLGIPIGDVDIATTALPGEVIRRAKAARIKSVPTGIDHGTVTLVLD